MMTNSYFANDVLRDALAKKGLSTFDALWNLDTEWFEAPNYRRGGWSGVSRYRLDSSGIFIKRQENHFYRAPITCFLPRATFAREFDNILRFVSLGIPTLDLIYFGHRTLKGKVQAILITRELEGYQSLDSLEIQNRSQTDPEYKKKLFAKLASEIHKMHECHMQHNCLYPKHIFVKSLEDGIDVRFIDLEKAKWRPFKLHASLRDLGTLYRHAGEWRATDKLRLFLAYRNESRLSQHSKAFIRKIIKD